MFPLQIKQAQDEERKQLIQLRDILKTALQVDQKEVSMYCGITYFSNLIGTFTGTFIFF